MLRCLLRYCHGLGTIDDVWFGEWIYLLTIYTHYLELQTVTTPSLITTVLAKPFPACCIFIGRFLAAASNSEDFSASHAQVLSSQLPHTELNSQLITKSVKSKLHCDGRSVSKSWCRVPSGAYD
jgi:hypothetical protein